MVWQERILKQDMRSYDIRSEWERDYARIIHSAAFRRLQGKTQVLGLGESDFYRTRLTHSIEVAQIGVGIVRLLNHKYANDNNVKKYIPDTSLMSAICLSHDLGHSPFGHDGEEILNKCMADNGGYESNAQTIRILSKLESYTEFNGINPTRRLYLGILKYPAPYSEVRNPSLKGKNLKPAKSYYDDDSNLLGWVLEPLQDYEKTLFREVEKKDNKNYSTIYKSLDTSIMEIADDVAYGFHDFEDAVRLKMIDHDNWEEFFDGKTELFKACGLDYKEISNSIFGKNHKRKDSIGKLINSFITDVTLDKNDNFITPLIKYNAKLPEEKKQLLELFKEIVREYVISNDNVKKMRFKSKLILDKLFNAYKENPDILLSKKRYELYLQEKTPLRVVSDYISGMTDGYALKMYDKLFIPGKGSIFDQI